MFLTVRAKVSVLVRRDTLASRISRTGLQEPQDEFVWNTVVEGILGEGKVTGVGCVIQLMVLRKSWRVMGFRLYRVLPKLHFLQGTGVLNFGLRYHR